MRHSRLLLLLIIPAAVTAGILFHVQQTLDRAAVTARDGHHLVFTFQTVDPAQMATEDPGFLPVASPNSFVAGSFFHGDLYLAGQTGLAAYSPEGVLRRTLRTGIELPTAPLTALTAGRLRGANAPELLIATNGQGLFVLEEDGAMRQMLPADPEQRNLTAVLALPTGDVLLGTMRQGLSRFTGSTLEPMALPGVTQAGLQITALAGDADPDPAGFWVGTRSAGLFHLHGGIVYHYDRSSGLPDEQVDSIAVTPTHVYAGTPAGIAEFAREGAANRPERVLAPGLFAHALAFDSASNELLAGTLDQGLEALSLAPRLRPAAFTATHETPGPVQQFMAAGPGSPYALTPNAVLRREPVGWVPVLASAPAALTDGNISSLAFDGEGRLWVGFFDRGLDILSSDLTRATHLESDSLFCINRLALDPRRKTMAAATANGLVLFDGAGHPRQTLTRRDGLISEHVNDVAFTRQGMAVATPAGISFVDPTGTQSLYAFQGLVNNHVYTLAQQPDGDRLLAGTLGGISLLDSAAEAVRRNLTVANSGLGHNWVTAIVSAPGGGWDVGTYGAGMLALSADGHFTAMDVPGKAELIVNPNAMLSTSSRLFAGTLGHGLYIYDRAGSHWTQVVRGLPSENVTAFAERDGQLFVGTDAGLVRITESKLDGAAR